MFTVMPASSTAQTVAVPGLSLTSTYTAQNGTVSNIQPSDVKVTFTSTSGSGTACSDEWALTTPAYTVSSAVHVYGVPFASSSASGTGASSSGQTGSLTVCADYKPSGSTKYYQASSSAFDPSYTSITSQTLQIKYASTAPGQCT